MIHGFIRCCIACLLAAASLGLAPPAAAGTIHSTDFTDMWWSGAAEDGWGVNITQQGEVLFATFFIYGSDQLPRWVVSPLEPQSAPAGTYAFSGKLYSTTGPWFGGPFNPANVTRSEVGTATLTFSSPGTATLNYSVNGVAVTKQITRQGWRLASPVGRFLGGFTFTASPCSDPNRQGNGYLQGIVTTLLNGTQVTFRVDATDGTGAVCTFSGGLAQQGRLSAVAGGTWSCVVGSTVQNQGTFSLTAIEVQVTGFNAAWSANDQSCVYNGRFGGVRDVVN